MVVSIFKDRPAHSHQRLHVDDQTLRVANTNPNMSESRVDAFYFVLAGEATGPAKRH